MSSVPESSDTFVKNDVLVMIDVMVRLKQEREQAIRGFPSNYPISQDLNLIICPLRRFAGSLLCF
jgi:hypothetical protein